MGHEPGRNKRFESVISLSIIAVLAVIAAGIVLRQSPNSDRVQQSAMAHLAPTGYTLASKPEIYYSVNLYEKIDGKADFYTDSGFEILQTCRFADSQNTEPGFEAFIYDMGTFRNAFSVYSLQKRSDAEMLENVNFGYKTPNAVFVVHGRYYIELIGYSQSQPLSKAMDETVLKIRNSLNTGNITEIPELALFPIENLVPESFRLYLNNAFGYELLSDTFCAQYEIDGMRLTGFVSRQNSAEQAQALAKTLGDFLIEYGAKPREPFDKEIKAAVYEFYETTEILLTAGPYLAGVHESQDQKAAEKLAMSLLDALK